MARLRAGRSIGTAPYCTARAQISPTSQPKNQAAKKLARGCAPRVSGFFQDFGPRSWPLVGQRTQLSCPKTTTPQWIFHSRIPPRGIFDKEKSCSADVPQWFQGFFRGPKITLTAGLTAGKALVPQGFQQGGGIQRPKSLYIWYKMKCDLWRCGNESSPHLHKRKRKRKKMGLAWPEKMENFVVLNFVVLVAAPHG